MSTVGLPIAPRLAHTGKVTQARVIVSEWTKLWSLRSTRYSLAAAFLLTIGVAALACGVVVHHWPQTSLHDRQDFHPLEVNLAGVQIAQLAIGVLGVLVITGEYSTGMIRATMTAVPKRLPVLWAKAIVYATVVLALATPAILIAFVVGESILAREHINVAFSHPGVLRVIFGAALYLTAIGLFGLGNRSNRPQHRRRNRCPRRNPVRPSPAHERLPAQLEQRGRAHTCRSTPARRSWRSRVTPTNSDPGPGSAILCAYTAAALAVASLLLVRRDT